MPYQFKREPLTQEEATRLANACTTAGFIAAVYGTATYEIPTYLFHYNANNNGDWKNASADRGGDRGDITGGP